MSRDHARAVVRPDLEMDGVAIELSPRSGMAISFTATKVRYDENQAAEVKTHPLRLSEDSARALYEALGRYFGGDAVSNTQLRTDYNHERARVDMLIGHLIRPEAK